MDGNVVLIVVGLIGVAVGFALGVAVTSLREPHQEKQVVDTSQIERRIQTPVARSTTSTTSTSPAAPVEAAPPTAPSTSPATPLADLPTTLPHPPSINTVDVLARVLQPELKAPEPPPLSIAAQIDEILQEMLQSSPLASRLIRLIELPSKGVAVMVGLYRYESVEAVPDEDIRQMIRLAVAEWERRVAE